jgi:hypothetical protein
MTITKILKKNLLDANANKNESKKYKNSRTDFCHFEDSHFNVLLTSSINKYIRELINEKLCSLEESFKKINLTNLIIKYDKENFTKMKEIYNKKDLNCNFQNYNFQNKNKYYNFENKWKIEGFKNFKFKFGLLNEKFNCNLRTVISLKICESIKNIISKESSDEVIELKKCIKEFYKLKSINAFIETTIYNYLNFYNFNKNYFDHNNFIDFLDVYSEIEEKSNREGFLQYLKPNYLYNKLGVLAVLATFGTIVLATAFHRYFNNDLTDQYKDIIKSRFDELYLKSFDDLDIDKFDIKNIFFERYARKVVFTNLRKYWILDNKEIYSSFLIVGNDNSGKTNIVNTLIKFFTIFNPNLEITDDKELNRKILKLENLKIILDERRIDTNKCIDDQFPNYEAYNNIILTSNILFNFNNEDKYLVKSFLKNKDICEKVLTLFTFSDCEPDTKNLESTYLNKLKNTLGENYKKPYNFMFSGSDINDYKIYGITENWLNDLINKIVQTNDSNLLKLLIESMINKN